MCEFFVDVEYSENFLQFKQSWQRILFTFRIKRQIQGSSQVQHERKVYVNESTIA